MAKAMSHQNVYKVLFLDANDHIHTYSCITTSPERAEEKCLKKHPTAQIQSVMQMTSFGKETGGDVDIEL